MNIGVDDELREILRQIADARKSSDEWALVESDDTFQSEHFVGGFDANENAFCFSYFHAADGEFWFQFDLDEVDRLLAGEVTAIEGRPAEK